MPSRPSAHAQFRRVDDESRSQTRSRRLGVHRLVTSCDVAHVSRSATISAVFLDDTGLGVGPNMVGRVIGVCKAFTSRVGSGPFPCESEGETAVRLRGTGENPWDEYGTTTGRARRVGWLDLVMLRHASRINSFTDIALTKLDILDPLDEIPVCIGYKTPQGVLNHFPADLETLEQAEPMYETLEGWGTSTEGILDYDDLPQAVKAYVAYIEEQVGVPVGLVSTGPKREQTILRHDSPLDRLTDGRLEAILAGQQNV